MDKKPSQRRSPNERITLRLPPDLYSKLVEAAQGGSPSNSLNSEIIERLYQSFAPKPKMLTIEEADARYEMAADAYMQTIRELQDRLQKAGK